MSRRQWWLRNHRIIWSQPLTTWPGRVFDMPHTVQLKERPA